MIEMVAGIFNESWHVLVKSAPFIVMGLFVAGVLKAVIPDGFVDRHLGGKGFVSVVKAALMGVPLPVCSCGVIPIAMGLCKQGAGKGATTAFLISTPETGVDSISITYALLDPLMTLVRPVAAFFTALTAGSLVNVLPDGGGVPDINNGCGCRTGCEEGAGSACGCQSVPPTFLRKVKQGIGFSFTELLGDIGPMFLLGVGIAGVIGYSIPGGFIERHLGAGIVPMLIMLVAGIPLYVCATASTPIVAALALKGLSPGAALVFMLVGPATNVTTITVVSRLMGKRVAVVYVGTIAVVSLLLGICINTLYVSLALGTTNWVAVGAESHRELPAAITAVVLLLLVARAYYKKRYAGEGGC